MTEVFIVLEPLLQTLPIVYEPYQVPVVKYNDHARAMGELVHELHAAHQLLAKYRQHVQDCESIDFLDQIGESDVTFTPAEKAALLALREENHHG